MGQVRGSSPEGISVTLGFFDDILIPKNCMLPGSFFDSSEQQWVWEFSNELEESNDKKQLPILKGHLIRFRVLQEIFSEGKDRNSDGFLLVSPYRIIGTISEDGLGLLSWWS